MTTTIETAFHHLDQLADLLRAEGFACGPDVWLSVYRLLAQFKRKNKLPHDTDQLRLLLGPLFCRNPEEQARFKAIYERWWTIHTQATSADYQKDGQSDAFTLSAPNRLSAPGQAALIALRQKIKQVGRKWMFAIFAVIAVVGTLIYFSLKYPTPPVTTPPQKQLTVPSKPDGDKQPSTQALPSTPIIDHIAPRSQPEPLRLTPNEKQWLTTLAYTVLALPWLIALLGLMRHYHAQRILKRQPATGDDLFNQLRFEKVLTPIWGGAQAEQALRNLRAAQLIPSHRLDIEATVEATARQGDYFYPVYRNRRIAPEHLMLVRSMHRNDQKAALVEELEQRFRELGLHIETYRFRDDPRWLMRWKDDTPTKPQYIHLDQLYARFNGARLIIISETDIIFHPLSGEPRLWLDALTPWRDKIWLHPQDAHAPHAALLAGHQFLLLPLLRASFAQWVNYFTTAQRTEPVAVQSANPIKLPELIISEPDAWLTEKPPYGVDLTQLTQQLAQFLGPYGLRLLRTIAAYPKPNWQLTQALDYLLYGHLNTVQQTMDPPERREQRLMRISRLPWLTHAHFPYWLRVHLLSDLDDTERERISSAWQRLFTQLTNKESAGTLKLEIRTLSKQALLLRLNELQASDTKQAINDPIFVQVLLGGQLDPLDFKLPSASAKELPHATRLLILRPALIVSFLAAIATLILYVGWKHVDESGWYKLRHSLTVRENSTWPVQIRHAQTTQPLALALSEALRFKQFTVKLDDRVTPDSTTGDKQANANHIRYAPGGQAIADQIAVSLRWLTYGESIESEEDSTLPASTIQVTLNRTYQPLTAFNDELHVPYVVPADEKSAPSTGLPFEEPQMVRIPPGSFIMGSPEWEAGRRSDEGPQRKVTLDYPFEIGRYEVTFAQYDAFAKETQYPLPDDRGWGRGDRPVINVSWHDAQAYVKWLSDKTGKKYRLPTEAEWEYVARADTSTAYWWGEAIGQNNAICNGCGSQWDAQQTAPVGSFKPNTFGVYDTASNVWEWTQDCWHSNYDGAPTDSSAWLEKNGGDCSNRVLRGGSWNLDPQNLRSANRLRINPDGANFNGGFRVARDLP